MRLWLLPTVLGGGRPLFAESLGSIDMELLDTKTSDRGATVLL